MNNINENILGKFNKSPIEKELNKIAREEAKIAKQTEQYRTAKWKETLEQLIPSRVYTNLQAAFCKAFELIFERGTVLIEKTYDKDEMEKDFQVHDYAVDLKGSRKELRYLKSDVNRANLISLAVSTVEGIGLGALGIGLPDIVLFLSVILRGTYASAVQYGFSYDTPEEQMYILKLLQASMSKGERWHVCNAVVDAYISSECSIQEVKLQEQIKNTADTFAMDMLLAKFVQGIPVAGILGGMSNPVYYNHIMHYVQLKYRKRYLTKKLVTQKGKNDE
ncbi:MAG: EcsC family protein [Lachnospiraceae bacterium]|nr:EcsC family protein [Lachnospiraceae bacterium]